jgi:fructose/tagatose bisphosphate aldolase
MPIISMSKLLADARREGYGVCYCEAWSLESFQAMVEAAEEERSLIIAGFDGGFLMHSGPKRAENRGLYSFGRCNEVVPGAFSSTANPACP